MAKSFVSPGVFTNEIDASFLGAGVGAIGAAIIGTCHQGPAFVPVTVTTNSEFESWFGTLDPDHMLGYAARAYLKNAGSANIVRVLGPAGVTVNGTSVTPGYTAESMLAVVANTGSVGAILALIEVTGSQTMVVSDLDSDSFFISASHNVAGAGILGVGFTCSFKSSLSSSYIKNVLNTDPTLFSSLGYYVREVYDYAVNSVTKGGEAYYNSASVALTNFARGFNSGSTTWIKSQLFGSVEHNLFKFHTLGHGDFENGRLKISIDNIRPSAAPSIVPYGKFDVLVRSFDDTDTLPGVVESFSNVSLDPTDPLYILRVIGDRFFTYDPSRSKMVEHGNFDNGSKLIRVELSTGSIPGTALPWGYRGLSKPVVASGSLANIMLDLPLVKDLLDKTNQAETSDSIFWGLETVLSGNVKDRLDFLPTMTSADTDFSLTNVSGNSENTFKYNASNPAASQKGPGNSDGHTTLSPTYAKFTLPVAFGFDGWDVRKSNPVANETELLTVSQLGTVAMRQAIDVVSDKDFIDVNLLLVPGVFSSKVVDYGLNAMRDRGDTFYPADISGSTATGVVQEIKNRGIDNNYGAVYYPGVNVYDDVNNQVVGLPASVVAAGAIAYNDRVSYPWFAPAGLNRAGLSKDTIGFDVTSLQDMLTQDERDTLYENRINPIARFPDVPQGVIWGQKTLQLKSSALDRINVRRLLIRAKKLIASAAKFLVFEAANASTMTRFKQLVNPILADIQQKQGIEQFKVVMDSTTTTPELIDRNMLAGKIFLIPTRSAEFISIDFVVSKSGASFEE
jgi:hypothetical protein